MNAMHSMTFAHCQRHVLGRANPLRRRAKNSPDAANSSPRQYSKLATAGVMAVLASDKLNKTTH
jgi:hypothetical protein